MPIASKSSQLYSKFDPRYISDCTLWLDALDTSSNSMTFSGSFVTVWKDKSASGNNATAGVGAEPSLGRYNGKQGLFFSGTLAPSYLTLTPSLLPNGTSSFSVFCVVTPISSSTSTLRMILNWGTASNPNAFRVYFDDTTNGLNQNYFTGSTANTDNTNVLNTLTIFSDTSTTSQTLCYRNGNAFSLNTSTVSYNIGTTFARIGTNSTTGVPFYGYIHEIIIYSTALSTTERQQVEGYLGWKWGVQASLASGHPYISTVNHGPDLSVFRPTTFSGCRCWIDASDTSSFSPTINGSTITAITNKAGGGTISINGSPTYSTTGLDGSRPAFYTKNGGFLVSLLSGLTNYANSTFIVSKLVSADSPLSGDTCVGIATLAAGSSPFYRCLDYTTGPPTSLFRVIAFFSGGTFYTTSLNSIVDSPFLYSSSNSGTTSTTGLNNYTNGGTNSATANVTAQASTPAYLMIGGDSSPYSGNFVGRWKGYISEVIVFDSVLTTSDRRCIEYYLANKWGMIGNLPSTHPFKSIPALKVN